MNSCELTASVTALSNALACKLNINELNFLGAVLSQFGDTLTTIAAQRTLCESLADNSQSRTATVENS